SDIIHSWKNGKTKKYDVGYLKHDSKSNYFFESAGVGVFTTFLKKIADKEKYKHKTPADNMKAAIKFLLKILKSAEEKYCQLEVDGKTHSDNYIQVEVVN